MRLILCAIAGAASLSGLAGPREAISLVEIPAGHFVMGSPLSEAGRGADEVQHDVTISRPFFMGRFEVTQQQWREFTGASPSHFTDCGPECPVERVTFAEIQDFLHKLNATQAEIVYRLATEAEWEYACRAGTASPFSTGANVTTGEASYDGRFPYATFAPGSPAGADKGRHVHGERLGPCGHSR